MPTTAQLIQRLEQLESTVKTLIEMHGALSKSVDERVKSQLDTRLRQLDQLRDETTAALYQLNRATLNEISRTMRESHDG